MTTTLGARAYTAAAAAAMPLAKATARPPSSAPTAVSNAAHVDVPCVRVYSPPPRKLEASTIGWFNGSPVPDGRPAVTATVAGESFRCAGIVGVRSDQCRREGAELVERQLAWRVGEHLDAHMAGAGVAVLLHSFGDRPLVPPRAQAIQHPAAPAVA